MNIVFIVSIVLAVGLVPAGIALTLWRARTRRKLEATYQALASQWDWVLRSTEDGYRQMLNDSLGIVKSSPPFEGQSKAELEKAQELWAFWLAHRQAALKMKQEAQALYEHHCNRRWWQFSQYAINMANKKLGNDEVVVDTNALSDTFKHLAGRGQPTTRTVTSASLPQVINNDWNKAKAELKRFGDAIQSAKTANGAVQQQLTGKPSAEPNSLHSWKVQVESRGLPLTPYQAALDELDSLAASFAQTVLPNPLSDFRAAQQTLDRKIAQLRSDFRRAATLSDEFAQLRSRYDFVVTRVSKLRSTPVKCAIPIGQDNWGASGEECYTLAEQNPDSALAQASQLIERLNAALLGGQLDSFVSLQPDAGLRIESANTAVDESLESQQGVDKLMSAITVESTQADIEADVTERTTVQQLYGQQKWSEALAGARALNQLHEQRKEGRTAVGVLIEPLTQIGSQLQSEKDIVSIAIDEQYLGLAQEGARLQQESAKGRAEWALLRQGAASVLERLTGSADSLASRIKAELEAYRAAAAAMNVLEQQLAQLKLNVSAKWGGEEAAAKLAEVEPAVTGALLERSKPKQVWPLVQRLAEESLATLAPAQELVKTALGRDQTFLMQLTSCETELEACHKGAYTRTICGEEFGRGIYCPTASPARHLTTARELYELRQYEGMAQAVELARNELCEAHLECWWLCLQTMSMSDDPCARQFAWQNGYADGAFDDWMKSRLSISRNGSLYNLPAVSCAKHSKAAEKKAVIDLPSIRDYEGLRAQPA